MPARRAWLEHGQRFVVGDGQIELWDEGESVRMVVRLERPVNDVTASATKITEDSAAVLINWLSDWLEKRQATPARVTGWRWLLPGQRKRNAG